jgi:hypothetical protein
MISITQDMPDNAHDLVVDKIAFRQRTPYIESDIFILPEELEGNIHLLVADRIAVVRIEVDHIAVDHIVVDRTVVDRIVGVVGRNLLLRPYKSVQPTF